MMMAFKASAKMGKIDGKERGIRSRFVAYNEDRG